MAKMERNEAERSDDTEGVEEAPPEGASFPRSIVKFLSVYRKTAFLVLWASTLAPFVLAYNVPEARCAYVVLLMVGYWITECLPIAVTSLIPIVLFPTFGILSSLETCACYMNENIVLLLGSVLFAVAIEGSNLHLRIALAAIERLGCSHGKLLGVLCGVTTFVSMWIPNTAVTAAMLPIVFATLRELEQAARTRVFDNERRVSERSEHSDISEPNFSEQTPTKITTAYLLAVAYCASIGGTGTLLGTSTNLAFKQIYESYFPSGESVDFGRWMIASLPQMLLNSYLTWIYLRVRYLGYLGPSGREARFADVQAEAEAEEEVEVEAEAEVVVKQAVRDSRRKLGPVTFHQLGVASLFALCVFLWIFRKPGSARGWSEALPDADVGNATPLVLLCILMFILPKEPSIFYPKPSEGFVTWNAFRAKMPWSLVFLLGGGFAIARATSASGLTKIFGNALLSLRPLPPILVLILVCLFVATVTEFASNAAIVHVLLPLIPQTSLATRIHPMYLMIPATTVCSFSFRLQAGTPPNAIAAQAGHLSGKTLLSAGCIPSVYAVVVQLLFFPTWGVLIYGIDNDRFPYFTNDTATP